MVQNFDKYTSGVLNTFLLTDSNNIKQYKVKFYTISTEALIIARDCLRDKYHVLPIGHPVDVIAFLEISISKLLL